MTTTSHLCGACVGMSTSQLPFHCSSTTVREKSRHTSAFFGQYIQQKFFTIDHKPPAVDPTGSNQMCTIKEDTSFFELIDELWALIGEHTRNADVSNEPDEPFPYDDPLIFEDINGAEGDLALAPNHKTTESEEGPSGLGSDGASASGKASVWGELSGTAMTSNSESALEGESASAFDVESASGKASVYDGTSVPGLSMFAGARASGTFVIGAASASVPSVFDGAKAPGASVYDGASGVSVFDGAKASKALEFGANTLGASVFSGAEASGASVFGGASVSGASVYNIASVPGASVFDLASTVEETSAFDEGYASGALVIDTILASGALALDAKLVPDYDDQVGMVLPKISDLNTLPSPIVEIMESESDS